MRKTQRCSSCILPETFPGIAFDNQKVCNFCSDQKTASILGEAKLKEILHAESGRIYDCVVPISGGKDSSYVLYYAVKIFNLRTIAVNYDSGFQSDLARENVRNVCNRLNVPLIVNQPNYRTHVKMLKEILHISEIVGRFFHTCMNCEMNIRTSAINAANENNVPFILYGNSMFEDFGYHPFLGQKAFFNRIRIKSVPRLLFHIAKYFFYSVRQRTQMKVPIKYRFQPGVSIPFPKQRMRVIHFFDYVEWDSIDKVTFLQEELGWKSPNYQEHRFDCLLHCFGNYRWLQECGISVDGFTYSTMIRANRMKREDAIIRERVLKERVERECLEIIKKVGLEDYRMPKNR